MSAQTAYFATGCFWGAERRFWKLDGVIETSVGYMGGSISQPSYEMVCTGRTGHTETVKVIFDSSRISYSRLLKEFWEMHDPTTNFTAILWNGVYRKNWPHRNSQSYFWFQQNFIFTIVKRVLGDARSDNSGSSRKWHRLSI